MSVPVKKDSQGRLAELSIGDSVDTDSIQPRTGPNPVVVGGSGGITLSGPVAAALSAGTGTTLSVTAGATSSPILNAGDLNLDAGASGVPNNAGIVNIGRTNASAIRLGTGGAPVEISGPTTIDGSAGPLFGMTSAGSTYLVVNTSGGNPLLQCSPDILGTSTLFTPVASYTDSVATLGLTTVFAASGDPEGEIACEPGSICHVSNAGGPYFNGLWVKSRGSSVTGWDHVGAGTYVDIAIEDGKTINVGDAVAASGTADRCCQADAALAAFPNVLGICTIGGTGDTPGNVVARIQTSGFVENLTGLTTNRQVYVSTTTPGALTTTTPTGTGNALVRVGFSYATTKLVLSTGPIVIL